MTTDVSADDNSII